MRRLALAVLLASLWACAAHVSPKVEENQAEVHYNWGIACFNRGQHDQAITQFTEAIELDPKYAMAYKDRAIACVHKGQYDQAISDCTKAIELNLRSGEVYYTRGRAYFSKSQLDPSIAQTLKNMGFIYYLETEYDKAWLDIQKAQSLSYQVPPGFLKALREASGRQE